MSKAITIQKYVMYARKSTDEADRQVQSIRDQIKELREYAEKEKLEVVAVFQESRTAKEVGRPIFNDMLARIHNGEAQGIIAWHPDRLARNSVDGGQIIHAIDRGTLTTLRFPTFWFEPTPQGKFMLSVAFGQSKYYVDNLSENVKRGLRNKARRGIYPSYAPIGYLNNRQNNTIVRDPVRFSKAKEMFEKFATGEYSLESIRDIAPLSSRGKKPSKQQAKRILTNTFYYGIFTYAGETHQGTHEPLITKKLFDEVQGILQENSRPRKLLKTPHPYRGLLQCAHCDCSITSSVQKGHIYYHCTRKRGNCGSKYVREEIIDKNITKALQKVSLSSSLVNTITTQAKYIATQESKEEDTLAQKSKSLLNTYETKLDRLLDMSLNDEITLEEYQHKKHHLLNEKTKIKEKLAFLRRGGNEWLELLLCFLNQAESIPKVALSTNLSEKAKLFREVGLNRKLQQFSVQYEPRNAWRVLQQQGEHREHHSEARTTVSADKENVPPCGEGGIRTLGAV